MYSVLAIVFGIPLIFSHSFVPIGNLFGYDFILSNGIGSFESIKMQFFLFLLLTATGEIFYSYLKVKNGSSVIRSMKYALSGISLFCLFSMVAYPYDSLRDLFFGVGEKQHGLLLPIGLIWLSILLSSFDKHQRRTIGYGIILSGCIVSLIAVIEFFGYNIFSGSAYQMTGSWGEVRSTSTLGNPNYVAGYLLILLPIIFATIHRKEKYLLIALMFLGIVATKSVIALYIGSIFLMYKIGKYYWPKYISYIVLLIVMLSLEGIYGIFHESEKWLSLTSRFVLMDLVLTEGNISWFSVIFGNGPDAIIQLFSHTRSSMIDAYFPPNMIIDSSHNIILDIVRMYGILGASFFLWIIVKRWKYIDHNSRYGFILSIAFLSLNVFVISHILLLVYIFSGKKQNA